MKTLNDAPSLYLGAVFCAGSAWWVPRTAPAWARAAGSRRDFDQARRGGEGEHPPDDGQRERGAYLGDRGGQAVCPVQDELGADEGQDDGEPGRQVYQPVKQACDHEVQGAQAEQGERVGREYDVGLAL